MEKFDRIFAKICNRLTLYVCGTIIVVMIFYVAGNVFSRYVLRQGGISGCYTYVGILLVPVVYLSLAYAWHTRSYLSLDLVQKKLKGRTLWIVQFTSLAITLLFFTAILLVGSVVDTAYAFEINWLAGDPGCYTIGWPWKASMIVGGLLLAIRNILDMITMVRTGEVINPDRQ